MAAAALGLSLLGAQAVGVANADPAADDNPSVSKASTGTRKAPPRRSASRQAATAELSAAQGDPVLPARRAKPAAARPGAASVAAVGTATAPTRTSTAPRRPAATTTAATGPVIAAGAAKSAARSITALLFNSAPSLNPSQTAPALDGVVNGSLHATDPDGDAVSYRVVQAPAHGQVTVDTDGRFTYTPAVPGQLAATDSFEVAVSDADSGFHVHGLLGLVNLLTFGLVGSAGHTTTRTVTLSTTPAFDPNAYILPLAPGVTVKAIQRVGDSPAGTSYPMVGAPDGLGMFDNHDGTFTLLMNHELGSGSGAVHAHGATGAFVSSWIIDKTTLEVVGGSDLIQRVFAWNTATQSSDPSSSVVAFSRFCSGDLAPVSAFSYDGLGTGQRIYLTGEEGGGGRAVATVATGPNAGDAYILGTFNPTTNGSALSGSPSYENLLANPLAQEKTVVIGNNDGGSGINAGALAVYVGTKQSTGTEADRAGLTNGVLKFVTVAGNAAEITDGASRATTITSGTPFTLSDAESTRFSRPEDGAWNPLNPSEYYFVTTDRLDQVSDGAGGQVGATRLWRLNFTDITDPDLGGTIDLLIDGDTVSGTKVNMFDNMTIDRNGRILIQEDTGGASHNGKIWRYDIATDTLTLLAQHDPARFGDIGIPATAPFTSNEESSGIVDAQDVLGPGWFLLTVQAHYPLGGALVEGGQLLALYDPVPG